MTLLVIVLAMLLSNDVWAVYGVVVHTESTCSVGQLHSDSDEYLRVKNCFSSAVTGIDTANATMILSHPTTSLLHLEPSTSSVVIHATQLIDSTDSMKASASITTPSAASTTSTSPAPTAKPTEDLRLSVKIGIGMAAGIFGLALLMVAFEACYLRRKRRERALQRAVDEVERGIDKSGSEERIVLESRVSIVFDDEPEEEDERGRHGMSLPRRD